MSEKKHNRRQVNGVRCPTCGIKTVRYRKGSDDYICSRCGTVFDRKGNAKKEN